MRKKRNCFFGVNDLTIEDLRLSIENALGIALSEGGRSYYGGPNFHFRSDAGSSVRLYSNFDDTRSDWIQEQYQDYSILIELSKFDDLDEIQNSLLAISDKIIALFSENT